MVTGYRRGEGNACRNLGHVYLSLGKYREAIKYYENDLAITVEVNDKNLEAIAYGNLGNVYFSLGKYQEAKKYYEKNLSIAVETCDKSEEGKAYTRLGTVYQVLSKYHEAVRCHKKALDIAVDEGDKSLEGKTYGNLGNAYQSLGECQKAIKCHEKDLQLAITMGDKAGEGNACMNLGNVFDSLGRYQDAKQYHEKQLNIAKRIRDRNGEAKAYASLGNVHQSQGEYSKAIEYHEKSLAIAVAINDSSIEGKCYGNLGNAYHLLGKYHEAITYHEKCLNIAINMQDKSGEGNAYGNLGNAFHSLGEYHKAIKYHGKHLTVAKETGDKKQEGNASTNLGNAYQSLGEYQKAIEYHEETLNLAKQIEDRIGVANAYGNLGNVYHLSGKHLKAIEYHEKNLTIVMQVGDKHGEANAYGNLGNAKNALGKYLEAITYHEKQRNIATEIRDCYGQENAYGSLGNDYQSIGNYGEARKCYEKCLHIAQDIGDKKGEGNAYGNLGSVFLSSGKYDQAIENYEKCLSNAVQLCDKCGEGTAYTNLGNAYSSLRKYEKALEYYEKQLVIAVKIGDRHSEGQYYGNVGKVYRTIGKYHDGIKYLKQCLQIAEEIGDKKTEGFAYVQIGLCYCQLSYCYKQQHDEENHLLCIKESENYLKKSLLCYEKLFDDLGEQEKMKISIVDTFILAYKLLTMVYIETKQEQKALLMTERGRARALGDILMAKYTLTLYPGSKLQLEYSDIENIVANRDYSILVFALEYRYVATWVLASQSPLLFVGGKIKGFELPINDLFSNRIDKKELLVTCITEIVNKAHDCMRVSEGANCEDRSLEQLQNFYLNRKEGDFEEGSSLPQAGEANRTETNENEEKGSDLRCIYDEEEFDVNPLEELFDIFVAPLRDHLKQSEVVIIPEGPLYAVPFAALRDSKTGLYLSEMMPIRIAPSLTTLKALQESSVDHHCKSGALIVGSPDVGQVMFRGKEKGFPNLRFAKQEAEEISELLGVKALTGSQATKEVIKQRLREGVAVIHFATHGSENGEIILAPSVSTEETNIPEQDDYILTMSEAQESGINAQLVVLSCCHSGRGEIKSEGVIGMSRAFLAAGARAVVASLWAIDDEATKDFMLKFYWHLKKGERASESLQQAMNDMRKGTYNEPKYWAPFILIGDNVTVFV
ncbi:tetratricopeptide repeat protein 28-like [Actinia tenebrosa]|uniref:Tetratricopeptide repeat protein 28-like n=1 Tax=Actinia tenebrosa TaxID=6105 RepID=A0A6P8HDL5_ACTTE|nr:tetratricopeptide repeat protein 28-like [Actinia tenebrosa]